MISQEMLLLYLYTVLFLFNWPKIIVVDNKNKQKPILYLQKDQRLD